MKADSKPISKNIRKGIVTFDLEKLIPDKTDILHFDLSQFLYKGLIIREKEFRQELKNLDWSIYEDKFVGIHCSTDAIIPNWAYMLVATYIRPLAKFICFDKENKILDFIIYEKLIKLNVEQYKDQRVVVKGCGNYSLDPQVYVKVSTLLQPIVKSLAFGEICSTVPIYKK